jgi:hypothetical protein
MIVPFVCLHGLHLALTFGLKKSLLTNASSSGCLAIDFRHFFAALRTYPTPLPSPPFSKARLNFPAKMGEKLVVLSLPFTTNP